MSRIKRVEVHEFAFELPGLGWDSGGFNIVYQPDNKLKMSKYAVAIEADDGARCEYVVLWGLRARRRVARARPGASPLHDGNPKHQFL